jgi:hypothetical protein
VIDFGVRCGTCRHYRPNIFPEAVLKLLGGRTDGRCYLHGAKLLYPYENWCFDHEPTESIKAAGKLATEKNDE